MVSSLLFRDLDGNGIALKSIVYENDKCNHLLLSSNSAFASCNASCTVLNSLFSFFNLSSRPRQMSFREQSKGDKILTNLLRAPAFVSAALSGWIGLILDAAIARSCR